MRCARWQVVFCEPRRTGRAQLSGRAGRPRARPPRRSVRCGRARAFRARRRGCRKRGSLTNARAPSMPSSPSPMLAWRSRFEPSGVWESLRCSEPTRPRPTTRSPSSSTAGERRRRADLIAGGEQVAGVQAQPEAVVPAAGVQQRRELLERAPERAAGAGRVLEVQRAALRVRERRGEHLAGTRDRRSDRSGQGGARMHDDGGRADPVADAQRMGQRCERLGSGSRGPRRRS